MSRFANLPLAVRLAAAFGLQAIALLLVTLLAFEAFGSFKHEVKGLSERDVRAVSLAGKVGQEVQSIGRLAAEHLYVYDGDLKNEDRIAGEVKASIDQATKEATELGSLTKGNAHMATFSEEATTWGKSLDEALVRSRAETVSGADDRSGSRDLYTGKVSPAMSQMFADTSKLQDSIEGATHDTVDGVEADAASRSRLLLIVMVVSMLIAVGFAVLITRSVVGPVRALMARLRSLDEEGLSELTQGLEAAAAGDFTRPASFSTPALDVSSTDELGQLARTFNEMRDKAERSLAAYTGMCGEMGVLIGAVARNAGSVSAGSQQVAASSEEAGRAVGEIANAVTDVAQGAERQVRMVEWTRNAGLLYTTPSPRDTR
jgi:HAMP domain-containing protein